MMIEYGLLMTPENLRIDKNRRAYNVELQKTEFSQIRACFTLIDRGQLWQRLRRGTGEVQSHVDLFGKFAIGLDPIEARRLGAIPVIYFYRGTSKDINMSMEILYNLRELRSLAVAIARIEARAAIPGRDTYGDRVLDELGYTLEGDPVVKERIERMSGPLCTLYA